MFGWGELGIIVVLAIVLLGPDKLPEVARKMGKIYAEYNNAKKRFEMEVFYGQDIPQKDFLEKMSQNKFDMLKQDISSNISDTTKNYLNTDIDNNKLDKKVSSDKIPKDTAESQHKAEVNDKESGESKNNEKTKEDK